MQIPEEYRIGEVEFFGRKFRVTADVLIPRFETEQLIRIVKPVIRQFSSVHICDVGTGSGIIGITLLCEMSEYIRSATLLDISQNALDVARSNLARHNTSAFTYTSDLLLKGEKYISIGDGDQYPIIFVSNLPYIAQSEYNLLDPEVLMEPHSALFGGEQTGFELYDRYIAQVVNGFCQNRKIFIIGEMGHDQQQYAQNTANTHNLQIEILSDLRGIDRFFIMTNHLG